MQRKGPMSWFPGGSWLFSDTANISPPFQQVTALCFKWNNIVRDITTSLGLSQSNELDLLSELKICDLAS